MSLGQEIRIVQGGHRRIKLFIDFWNVVINGRNQCKNFKIDIIWDRLADYIVSHTRRGFDDNTHGEIAGCYIFGSFSKSNPDEKKFIDGVLDRYGSIPGLFFSFSERIQKKTSINCSGCGEIMKHYSESGVDVLLSVEMIKHSTMKEHEYLGLISSDRDFLPLLSYLRDQGQRVLHVATAAPDRDMRSVTWSQINLTEAYPSLSRILHDDYIILTAPPYESDLAEVIQASPVPRENLRVIDLSQKDQISDKDLIFLMSNIQLYWYDFEDDNARFGSKKFIEEGLSKFRKMLEDGSIYGNLPYIIKNGSCVLYANRHDSEHRWIRMSDSHAAKDWKKLYQRA